MNMRITVTQTVLGNFKPANGKVIVSDPCYESINGHNRGVQLKEGTYTAKAKYGVIDEWWGERVVELTINHESCPKKKATSLIGWCGVDSGQCGIFERENYDKYHPNIDTPESEQWYQDVCNITLNDKKHNCGMVKSNKKIVGAVASSGLGDGAYDLYAGYNSKGEIVALRLRFL